MRILIIFIVFLFSAHSFAGEAVLTASSPDHRVAVLELYTSQGCSSCPPAEQWLSRLKKTGISSKQLIPLAFHVTYWDYIGWKDRFASERFDSRQREIARNNSQTTVYTPQFVLSGSDYRTHKRFSSDISNVVSMPSSVDLTITAKKQGQINLGVELSADTSRSEVKDVALFLVLYENNLSSDVEDGENEGKHLHHDYVVRRLYGPFIQSAPIQSKPGGHANALGSVHQSVSIDGGWKGRDLNLVAFAQNPHTGEVLQAVSLKLDYELSSE